jgi:hypothetical protein
MIKEINDYFDELDAKEAHELDAFDMLGILAVSVLCTCGFMTIVSGAFLLTT